jgi:hypothetical protein
VSYERSVRQYLRDRREGRACVTRLSFPVHDDREERDTAVGEHGAS